MFYEAEYSRHLATGLGYSMGNICSDGNCSQCGEQTTAQDAQKMQVLAADALRSFMKE